MSAKEVLQLIGIIAPIFLFFMAANWGVIRWLANRLANSLTEQISATNQQIKTLGETIQSESDKIADVEKSLLRLQAELPKEYVRREDHIRYSAVIEAKLDSHAAALQNLNLNVQRVLDRQTHDEEERQNDA